MPSKSPVAHRSEVQKLLAAAVAACEDKKAEDIRILALDPAESGLTDYFLICSGNSDRQNVAITDEIEIRLNFIVHVFSAEKRAYYGLERLRKTATVLSVAELNAEIKSAIAAGRSKPAAKSTVAKKGAAKKAPAKKAPAKSVSKSPAKAVARKAAKKATAVKAAKPKTKGTR
jgi:ribosome-associated protein